MGDFEADTRVAGGNGRYTARISADWEIWGPCGGYVAALLLRAAGAHSPLERVATLSAHFLGTADFTTVTLETATLRRGRRSESVRVSMRQEDRPIAEALVWLTSEDVEGFEYDWSCVPPEAGEPQDHPTIQELVPGHEPWHPFWNNFEYRPLGWIGDEAWTTGRPFEPRYSAWFRYLPEAAFDDPVVEAGRIALLCDIQGWPAAHRAIEDSPDEWIAPNMDVSITFHRAAAGAEHLFLDAAAPVASRGLVGASGTVWAPDGRLLATATQQMLARRVPAAG